MSDTSNKANGEKSPASETKPGAVKMPGAAAFEIAEAAKNPTTDSEFERNEVFTSLVTGDTDITGLVAYSIYKQNKHDWLVAFNKVKMREPNEAELFSYIVGESTPRRLATYRHLAQATLEGRGPTVNVGPATEKFVPRNYTSAASAQPSGGGGNAVTWIIALIVAVAAVLLAGKYGIPGLR